MTHLTAYTVATVSRDSGLPAVTDRHGCKYLLGKVAAQRVPIRTGSAFRNGMAICLELRDADFHYSVIGRSGIASLVSGSVDCRSSNDEVATTRPREGRARCFGIRRRKMTLQPIEPAMLRTGGRKNNADEYGFSDDMQVNVMVGDSQMMRIDENIPATHPPYATVAPILHKQMRTDATSRGTNPNDGAAE
jgi:hypothetical protein